MRQGDGSDFLNAGDPRSAEIGVVYVEAKDTRQEILTAINLFNMQGRKQVVLVLSEPRQVFRESVDFDGLKRARRDLRANVMVIAPSGSPAADFARSRHFPVYSSLENLKHALLDESSDTAHAQSEPPKKPGLLAFGSRKVSNSGRAQPTTMARDGRGAARGSSGGPGARSLPPGMPGAPASGDAPEAKPFPAVPPTPQQQGSPLSPLPPTASTPRTQNQPAAAGTGGWPQADKTPRMAGVPPTPPLPERADLSGQDPINRGASQPEQVFPASPPPTPRLADQVPPTPIDPRGPQGKAISLANARKEPPSTQDDALVAPPGTSTLANNPSGQRAPQARQDAEPGPQSGVPGQPAYTQPNTHPADVPTQPASNKQAAPGVSSAAGAPQQGAGAGRKPETNAGASRKGLWGAKSKATGPNAQGEQPQMDELPPTPVKRGRKGGSEAPQERRPAPGVIVFPGAVGAPAGSGKFPASEQTGKASTGSGKIPAAQSQQAPGPSDKIPAAQAPDRPSGDAGKAPGQPRRERGGAGEVAAAGALGAAALAAGAASAGPGGPNRPARNIPGAGGGPGNASAPGRMGAIPGQSQPAPTASGKFSAAQMQGQNAPGQPPNAPAGPGRAAAQPPNAPAGPGNMSGQLQYGPAGPGNAPDQSQRARGGAGKFAAAGALGAAALAAGAVSGTHGSPVGPGSAPNQPPHNMPNEAGVPGQPPAGPTGTARLAAAGAMGGNPNGPVGQPIKTTRQVALTPLPSPVAARRRRLMWRRSLLILGLLLLIGGLVAALVPHSPLSGIISGHVTANVTITPLNKLEMNNFFMTAKPGATTSVANRQVQARVLTSTSPTQNATANATGSIQATTAQGSITLQNTNGSGVTLGTTTLTSKSGVQVTFNGVFVPGLGSAKVPAYAVKAGATGNIPAVDFPGQCCGPGIFANNPSPFTGGQDAVPNSVIQQGDIDGAVNPLVGTLTTATKADLQKQVRQNERVVDNSLNCTPTHTADHKPGDQAKQVTVSVSVQCSQEAYDFAAAVQMATGLLQGQAEGDTTLTPFTQFTLDGQVVTNLVSASVVSAGGQVALTIQARGLWVYQFTAQMLQNIKRQLVKLSQRDAQTILQNTMGVQRGPGTVKIDISSGTTMPANPDDITLTVRKLPGASGTPVAGPPGGSNSTPSGNNGTATPGVGPGPGTPGGSDAPGPGIFGSPGNPDNSNAPGPGVPGSPAGSHRPGPGTPGSSNNPGGSNGPSASPPVHPITPTPVSGLGGS